MLNYEMKRVDATTVEMMTEREPFPREWTAKIAKKRNESHFFVVFKNTRIYSTVCLTTSLWRHGVGQYGEPRPRACSPWQKPTIPPPHCQAAFAA